jgi:hypothetical protein
MLQDIGIDKDFFLDKTSKAQEANPKIDKWDFIKLNAFAWQKKQSSK